MKRKQQAKGIRKIGLMVQAIAKQLVSGLLRFWYVLNRRRSSSSRRSSPSLGAAGFVLPTVILVLLILSLLIGALVIRSGERAGQVVSDRAASTVYNAATPAVDRAKSKIEAVFAESRQVVREVPNQEIFDSLLENDAAYTLPDEERLDLDGDNTTIENAWRYRIDFDGDGQEEVVSYSIALLSEIGWVDADNDGSIDSGEANVAFVDDDTIAKAENQVTRTGPLTANATVGTGCPISVLEPNGWFTTAGTARLSKNFQVNAVVESNNEGSQALTTLEFQQDRQVNQGNFWGAWFRYDLELTPGDMFRWNGAMHTDGNLLINNLEPPNRQTQLYLISSPFSCLYSTANASSQITLADIVDEDTGEDFQGQVVSTNPGFNESFESDNAVKVYRWPGTGIAPDETGVTSSVINALFGESEDLRDLTRSTDSSDNGSKTPRPYTIALDPIVLFTEDRQASRYSDDPTNRSLRDTDDTPDDPAWEGSVLNERIFNDNAPRPFVDDTYRADDRWGPKPRYTEDIDLTDPANCTAQGYSCEYGERFDANTPVELFNLPPAEEADSAGLDGHWERRAFIDGLRIIVGQRLELGNPFGWKGANDPLYPPDSTTFPTTATGRGEFIEQLQRRTLRDNLAAVQATAVYHSANSSDTPVACIATTAHPSTEATLQDSTDFTTYFTFDDDSANQVNLQSNFFFGKGTNGWEYETPTVNATTLLDTAPLGRALRNLAYFSGDPDGAFPPIQESATDQEHPDRVLTMWGNFSNLRRIFDEAIPFDDLSIADRSTLDTASCLLGILADNISAIESYSYTENITQIVDLADDDLSALIDGDLNNGEVFYGTDSDGDGNDVEMYLPDVAVPLQASTDPTRPNYVTSSEAYVTLLKAIANRPGATAAQIQQWRLAETLHTKEQIKRDRELGFARDDAGTFCGRDDATSTNIFGLDPGTAGNSDRIDILVDALCSTQPKFPALYYLFPIANHDHSTGQPPEEPYIDDDGDADTTTLGYTATTNSGITYQTVDPTNPLLVDNIALAPRATLTLPTTGGSINRIIDPNGDPVFVPFLDRAMFDGREQMEVRTLDIDLEILRREQIGGDYWLPESEIVYAFREDAVREDAIARPRNADWSACNTEELITDLDPNAGQFSEITGGSDLCRMRLRENQDPPVLDSAATATAGISPKPVDMYPDPDRRPHGFRLSNGACLWRGDSDCDDSPEPAALESPDAGLTFVSDNPVYIFGDFNLHTEEEFTVPLEDDWSNFYERGDGTPEFGELNCNYADGSDDQGIDEACGASDGITDNWRRSAILADAVTILSENFCSGTVESGLYQDNAFADGADLNCTVAVDTTGASSYRNSRWLQETDRGTEIPDFERWLGENPLDITSPIRFDSDGQEYYVNTSGNNVPLGQPPSTQRIVISDRTTRDDFISDVLPRVERNYVDTVNAQIVSGIVPSRASQYNGGMHNFPRFLENWSGNNGTLNFSGSLIQLNFSTYATMPFDQENLYSDDPQSTTADEFRQFYQNPIRQWGYDVALQYVGASPAARRFTTIDGARSEYYRELPADDPYIQVLLNAN